MRLPQLPFGDYKKKFYICSLFLKMYSRSVIYALDNTANQSRRRGRAVRQRSAKPSTAVQIRPSPLFLFSPIICIMATTADLRKGAVLKFNNDPCLILESEHRTPGNLRAFYQVKMRNLRSGKLTETRFRSGETLEFLRVEKREYQFLYKDGDSYVFMDKESYDQVSVDPKIVGDYAKYLKEGSDSYITFNEADILSIEMPSHVILRVMQTEPGVKGDSVNNIMKPAIMETGAEIPVPIFVNEGDMIRIDTSNGAYVERVKV